MRDLEWCAVLAIDPGRRTATTAPCCAGFGISIACSRGLVFARFAVAENLSGGKIKFHHHALHFSQHGLACCGLGILDFGLEDGALCKQRLVSK